MFPTVFKLHRNLKYQSSLFIHLSEIMPKNKKNVLNSKEKECKITEKEGAIYSNSKNDVVIKIHAKPGAKESAVTDISEESVGVQIAAQPVDGEANKELLRYLAEILELRKSDISLEKANVRIIMKISLFLFVLFMSSSTLILGCFDSENFNCTCNLDDVECIGSGEDSYEIQELFSNVSIIPPTGHLHSMTLNMSSLVLPSSINSTILPIKNLSIIGGIQHLRKDTFDRAWNNLESLRIRSSDIKVIEDMSFSSLHNLSELYLDENSISEIHPDAFINLSALKTLSLSMNQVNSIGENALQSLPALQTLILNGNNISSISNDSFVSAVLKSLHLQNNHVKGFLEKDSLSGVPQLTYLDLSSNELSGVNSSALSALSHLRVLNVSKNSIQYLKESAFSRTQNLEILDLSENKIQLVPFTAFSKLHRLKRLDLHSNMLIAMLCLYTTDLHALETVDLRSNFIKSFEDKTFSYSPNLKYLFIKGNPLDDKVCPLNTSLTSIDIVMLSKNCKTAENCENYDYEEDDDDYFSDESSTTTTISMSALNVFEDDSNATENEFSAESDLSTSEENFSHDTRDIFNSTNSTHASSHVTTEMSVPTTESEDLENHPTNLLMTTESSFQFFTNVSLSSEVTDVTVSLAETSSNQLAKETEQSNYSMDSTLGESTTLANEPQTLYTSFSNASESDTTLHQIHSSSVYSKKETISLDDFTTNPTSEESSSMETETPPMQFYNDTSNTAKSETAVTTSSTGDDFSSRKLSASSSKTISKTSKIHLQNYKFVDDELCFAYNLTGHLGGGKQRCSLRYQYKGSWKSDSIFCPKNGSNSKHCKKFDRFFSFCLVLYISNKRTHQDCSKEIVTSSDTKIPTTTVMSVNSAAETDPIYSTTSNFASKDVFTDEVTHPTPTNEIPTAPFKVLSFSAIFNDSDAGLISWQVNRQEHSSLCNLTLSLISTLRLTEIVFPCLDSSFLIKELDIDHVNEICLTSYHKKYGKDTKCKLKYDAPEDAKASTRKDHGFKNSSLVALSILLLVVVAIIIILIIRNLLKKRSDRDRYNVHYQEQNVQKRLSSRPNEPNIRYSFIPKE